MGASLAFFVLGTTVGYPTKALPQLTTESDPKLLFDEQDASWFAAISPLMGMLVTSIGGWLSGKFGRRTVMLIGMPLVSLGWVIIALSQDKVMIFSGRIITCARYCI